MKTKTFLSIAVSSLVALWAVIGIPASAQEPANADEMREAMQQLAEQMQAMQQQPGAAEPVDFRKLKEFLPEQLLGLPRAESDARKNEAMGIATATASATYRDEGDADHRIDVKITDTGTMGGYATMAQHGLAMDFEEESATSFHRSVTVSGIRGRESWDGESGESELTLLIQRLVIEILAEGFGEGASVEAAKQLPLEKAKALLE
ncbi:MAG: hypothetical protein JSV80_13235 [Acidobacteriota bacterium]|nr:MAG: hypothetical protein JSV80_13235 [Acidobacteriota bacterium]